MAEAAQYKPPHSRQELLLMAEEAMRERDPQRLRAMSLKDRQALFQEMAERVEATAAHYGRENLQGWQWAIRQEIYGLPPD